MLLAGERPRAQIDSAILGGLYGLLSNASVGISGIQNRSERRTSLWLRPISSDSSTVATPDAGLS